MKEELRIGNWVDYNDYPNKGYTRLNEHLMTCAFSDENWANHFILPIPLTEEILLKCGFEKEGSTVYINIGSIEIGTVANCKRFYIQISSQNITLEIKSLHQIQNLYFALTNQELNIEL